VPVWLLLLLRFRTTLSCGFRKSSVFVKVYFHITRIRQWYLAPLEAREARKCSAAQGPHSEVVPRAFWRFVSKSYDECKGSFSRGCEAKRWTHWTCALLGTIFQPMRINSVPDIKCYTGLYRVSQEERAERREGVPYVKLYRYNPKHLYPKLNCYGDNGHRKVWASGVSTYCTPSVTPYSSSAHARQPDTAS